MRKVLPVIIALFLFAAAFGGGYALGTKHTEVPQSDTFYAIIESISGSSLRVKGLEINDINTRGEFDISVDGDTEIVWHFVPLYLDELNVGDTIAVTHTGEILETYPGRVAKTIRIKLLDDEL